MWTRIFFGIVTLAVTLSACSIQSDDEGRVTGNIDIRQYIKNEAEKLSSSGKGLVKVMYHDHDSETVVIDKPAWEQELKPFREIDINAPAMRNNFKTDTSLLGTDSLLTFTAKDSSTKLRSLVICVHNSNPKWLIAVNKTQNLYYTSTDTIGYFGDGNFRVSAYNKPSLGKEISFTLYGKAKGE